MASLGVPSAAAGPPLPEKLLSAPPNTWVRIDKDGHGRRSSAALVFARGEGRFLLLGGCMSLRKPPGPYDEQTLNLQAARWENRFPAGKEAKWGGLTGPAKAPPFPRGSPLFEDGEGNVRPNLRAGYGSTTFVFNNFALDTRRGRIVVLWPLPGVTSEYDPARRTWQVIREAGETPRLWDESILGGICYDPANGEVLGGQGRWAYKDGRWRRLEFGSRLINALRGKATALRRRLQALATACRARYYVAEGPAEARRRLDEVARGLLKGVDALAAELGKSAGSADDYEKTQIARARVAVRKARGIQESSLATLGGAIQPPTIHAAEDVRDALAEAELALAVVPPRRAFSRMAYDERSRKIVLFGGHALDRLLADTWVYDCAARRWEQRRPKRSPPPRAGHGLCYLPDSGKVLLVDGWGAGKTGQTWTYDTAANEWALLAEGAAGRPPITEPPSWGRLPNPAAAAPGDVVVALGRQDTWAARIDASRVDAAGTARLGAGPGTVRRVGGEADEPRWYERSAGRIDPAEQQARLAKLPANRWVRLPSAGNRPNQNRAWSALGIDAERGQLLHWGGGHVAYTGNAVVHYSLRSNRYFITYPPEFGIVFAHGEGGMPISRTYQGRAFMTGHSYKGYAYDPLTRRMWACGQSRWFRRGIDQMYHAYDPGSGTWRDRPVDTPFDSAYSRVICLPTPGGLVVWARSGLWRLEAKAEQFRKLPLDGKLPAQRPDYHGMSYDSRRDRLLLSCLYLAGDLCGYDVKTGRAGMLEPANRGEHLKVATREQAYLPGFDAVLYGVRVAGADGSMRWLVYDCGENAWCGLRLGGSDPISQGSTGRGREEPQRRFCAALGLAYDPARRLVWAMNSYSVVYVLRPDLRSGDLLPLRPPDRGEKNKKERR